MKVYMCLLAFLFSSDIISGERGMLVLRGFVPPAISTKITQTSLGSTSSIVTFSSEMNSKYFNEQQKIEVEGIDQEGLEAQLQLLSGNKRIVQYKLLLSKMSAGNKSYRPIILKISAN